MPAAVALKDWESYTQLRTAYDVAQRAYPYKSPDCEVVVANFDGAFALTRADSDAVADAVDRLKRFGKNVPYLNRAEGLIFVEGLIDAEVHLESCLEYLSSFALEFRTAPIEKLITKIKVLQHAINRRDAVSVPSKLPRSERQPT